MAKSKLEEAIGVGQGSISHQVNKGSDFSFFFLLKATRHLCPQNEVEVMKQFIALFQKIDNKCISMEYALSIWDFELCRELIAKNREYGNVFKCRKSKDWADIFEIALHMQERSLSQEERFKMVQEAKPKTNETKTLIKLLKCSILFHEKNWNELQRLMDDLENEINAISNEYIKSTFTSRLNSLKANVYLYFENNPLKARQHAELILQDEFPSQAKRHATYILGSTYMLESYEKGLQYFNEYIENLKRVGAYNVAQDVLDKDVAFLKNHWNVELEELQTNDLAEKAHNLYKRGEVEEANKIFDQLEETQGELTSFQKYYKGMNNNDLDLLYESLIEFLKAGNKFYASMPLVALEKYETYCKLARMLYTKF